MVTASSVIGNHVIDSMSVFATVFVLICDAKCLVLRLIYLCADIIVYVFFYGNVVCFLITGLGAGVFIDLVAHFYTEDFDVLIL